MHDHDPDDAEMRAWLADGKAPHGLCPYCGSTISVTQRDGWFRARCSHRGCGASGPRMRQIGRAVEMLARPPAYVARHMGVHPSSLTDVVSVLEGDRDVATARAEAAEAEVARLRELHSEERTRIEHASTRALAIRQAAGVCRQMQEALENLDARRRCLLSADVQELALSDAEDRILALLDAAPAAEGGEP